MPQCFIMWAGSWGSDRWDGLLRLHSGLHCTPDLRMPRPGAWKAWEWSGASDRGVMDLSGAEANGHPALALVEFTVLGVLDKCPHDSEIRWRIQEVHLAVGWPQSWQRSCHLPVGRPCPCKDAPGPQPRSSACKTCIRIHPWSAL